MIHFLASSFKLTFATVFLCYLSWVNCNLSIYSPRVRASSLILPQCSNLMWLLVPAALINHTPHNILCTYILSHFSLNYGFSCLILIWTLFIILILFASSVLCAFYIFNVSCSYLRQTSLNPLLPTLKRDWCLFLQAFPFTELAKLPCLDCVAEDSTVESWEELLFHKGRGLPQVPRGGSLPEVLWPQCPPGRFVVQLDLARRLVKTVGPTRRLTCWRYRQPAWRLVGRRNWERAGGVGCGEHGSVGGWTGVLPPVSWRSATGGESKTARWVDRTLDFE